MARGPNLKKMDGMKKIQRLQSIGDGVNAMLERLTALEREDTTRPKVKIKDLEQKNEEMKKYRPEALLRDEIINTKRKYKDVQKKEDITRDY